MKTDVLKTRCATFVCCIAVLTALPASAMAYGRGWPGGGQQQRHLSARVKAPSSLQRPSSAPLATWKPNFLGPGGAYSSPGVPGSPGGQN